MLRKLSSSVMQTSGILTISLHSKWVSGSLLLQQLPSWCLWARHQIVLAINPTQASYKAWNSHGCITAPADQASAVPPLDLIYALIPRSCSILHRSACYRETFAFSMANTLTNPHDLHKAESDLPSDTKLLPGPLWPSWPRLLKAKSITLLIPWLLYQIYTFCNVGPPL